MANKFLAVGENVLSSISVDTSCSSGCELQGHGSGGVGQLSFFSEIIARCIVSAVYYHQFHESIS